MLRRELGGIRVFGEKTRPDKELRTNYNNELDRLVLQVFAEDHLKNINTGMEMFLYPAKNANVKGMTMLRRNLADSGGQAWWQDLSHGAATISALARLCSQSLVDSQAVETSESPELDVATLPVEARTLLKLAQQRGTFEIRAKKDGFDSAERLLAVAVEVEPEQWRLLLDKSTPRQTVRFLEAFAMLCGLGLVIHHVQAEFSFSSLGFEKAAELDQQDAEVEKLMGYGVEVDG